ncbi:hypothetical protein CBS101457_006241 [Exobasidium rhododendri]|nr:hypothetical protein CBS101457_006241 [Exobasidium rhododendri]
MTILAVSTTLARCHIQPKASASRASALVRKMSSSAICSRNTPARRPRDPLETAPNAVRHAIPTGETFIVRPPPSADSPYNLNSGRETTVYPTSSSLLPPALRPSRPTPFTGEAKLLLDSADIEKVQKLRASDPFTNTATSLSKRFKVSPAYIQIVAPLQKEIRAAKEKEVETRKANWGANKTMQRQLRAERKSLW